MKYPTSAIFELRMGVQRRVGGMRMSLRREIPLSLGSELIMEIARQFQVVRLRRPRQPGLLLPMRELFRKQGP